MTYSLTLTVTIPTGLSKEEEVEFREEKRRAYIRYLKSLSEKRTSLLPLKPDDPIVMKPAVKQGPSTPPTLFEFLSPRGRELAAKYPCCDHVGNR